jgi:hypothetical protein
MRHIEQRAVPKQDQCAFTDHWKVLSNRFTTSRKSPWHYRELQSWDF